MAKVQLIEGKANITPWGQRNEGNDPFHCDDEEQLAFYKGNARYRVGDSERPPARVKRTPAVVQEPAPPSPEPEEAKQEASPLDVLDASISALSEALSTGEYDEVLDELLEAEESGKTRKGAVQAINERAEHLANL